MTWALPTYGVFWSRWVNGVGRGQILKNTIRGYEEGDAPADKSERATRTKAKVGWLGQCQGAPECPREEDVPGVQGSRGHGGCLGSETGWAGVVLMMTVRPRSEE